MRKLVAGFAASLDGYIEGLNKEHDWILIDKEINFAEQMKRFDCYLYGKSTYEGVAKMGSSNTQGTSHYVFSKTLESVKKGFNLVKGDTESEVLKIKQGAGKDIALFGGAGLLTSLLNLNLVDEIEVVIIPVLLGSGKPMVELLPKRIWLNLQKTHTYSNGSVLLTYDVKNNPD